MRIGVTSICLLLPLLLFAKPDGDNQSVTATTYQRLDEIRNTKKKQLLDYLKRVRTKASEAGKDTLMLKFFQIKRTYCRLRKTKKPPEKLVRMIDELKKGLQEHYLRNYLIFHDILFIDKNGDIFYTVRKEEDYKENIFQGELGKTRLAKQLKSAPTKTFVDYCYYAVSDEPSAFIVEPVHEDKDLAGWLVMQCTINKINSLFGQEEKLGTTGEAFLVNQERQMLTDSRFFGESSILKRHLSKENITAKFREKKGHKMVTDYRGFRALSSFEVCPVMGSKWLLIAKIDEDEVITEQYKRNSQKLKTDITNHFTKQKPCYCAEQPVGKENVVRVNIDEFRKAANHEILFTPGVSTCTALVVCYPGKFAYLTHISPYDKLYGGESTDLVSQIIKRIKFFDIYKFERRKLQFVIVAKHLNTLTNAIDDLVAEGFFLSQIRFVYNPQANYGSVRHDYVNNRTFVGWKMAREQEEHYQEAGGVENIGDLVKRLIDYQ